MDLAATPYVSFKLPAGRLVWREGAETLTLRPQSLQDGPAVYEGVQDSLPELKRFMPWAHAPSSLEFQIERAKGAAASYWGGKDMIFCLWGEDQLFRGCFGLHWRTLNDRGLEIGFWVRSRYAGRGYATAATQALIVYCFDYLACTRVQCGANEGNRASQRVQEKCGFKLEGKLRNFESPATEEMRAAGYAGKAVNLMTGLIPEDLAGLDWVAAKRKALEVYDWQERRVPPPL